MPEPGQFSPPTGPSVVAPSILGPSASRGFLMRKMADGVPDPQGLGSTFQLQPPAGRVGLPGQSPFMRLPLSPLLFKLGASGGGGGGGAATIVLAGGLGRLTSTFNGVDTYTVEGNYAAGNGIAIDPVGNQISAYLSGSGQATVTPGSPTVISVPDMKPTAGADIAVSGTQVDWDPRILWGLCLVNATVDLTSGPPYVISTGVAAVNAYGSPFNYYKWRYKCVPIQLTGVINTGTGAWSIAYDNSDSRLNAGLSGASAYRSMWNKNEYGNVTNWVDPGVFVGTGGAYPTNFNPMPLGYDQNAGTWRSVIRPFMRYRVSGTTYEWLIADPQAHDGTCDSTSGSAQDGFWQ